MSRKTIKQPMQQLIWFILLPTLLFILILIIVSIIISSQRNLELQGVSQRSNLQANLFSEKISGKLTAFELILTSLDQQIQLMDLNDENTFASLQDSILSYQLMYEELEGVCILDEQGEKRYSTYNLDSENLLNMRKDLIINHVEQELPFSMLAFTDANAMYIVFSRYVKDITNDNSLVVALIIKTNTFFDLLNLTSIPGLSSSFMYDTQGKILAYWKSEIQSENNPLSIQDLPFYQDLLMRIENPSVIQSGIHSITLENQLLTTTSLSGFPYTFAIQTDLKQAMALYDKSMLFSFSVLIFFILLSLGFIILLGLQVIQKNEIQENMLKELAHKVQERTAELELLCQQDTLTTLANRRKINELLEKAIIEGETAQNSFSIMILDIDNFKKINDTYGHQVGDLIIQEIVMHLQALISSKGILARWGGDELMVYLPSFALQQSLELAETLRYTIDNAIFSESIHITLSFGLTQYLKGDSIVSVIKRADLALYQAKECGRNRVKSM